MCSAPSALSLAEYTIITFLPKNLYEQFRRCVELTHNFSSADTAFSGRPTSTSWHWSSQKVGLDVGNNLPQ